MLEILRPDRVYCPETGCREGVDVAIADGRIVGIADRGTSKGPIIALPGLTLMPGYINLNYSFLGSGRHAPPSSTSRMLRAVRNANLALAAGVTTMLDLNCDVPLVFELAEAQRLGELAGPRVVCSGQALAWNRGAAYLTALDCRGAQEIRAGARRQLLAGADVISLIATGGFNIPVQDDVGQCQLTDEELQEATETAHGYGKIVSAHALGIDGVRAVLRAGVDLVQGGTGLDESCADRMVQRGTTLVPALSSYAQVIDASPAGYPEAMRARARSDRPRHVDSVRLAVERGVSVAFGTGGPTRPQDDVATEFRSLQDDLGMSTDAILRAATIVGARALGIEAELGSLAPGKAADLVAVAGDPRIDPGAWTRVHTTWIGGVVRYGPRAWPGPGGSGVSA